MPSDLDPLGSSAISKPQPQSEPPLWDRRDRFRLRAGGALVLESDGFRLISSRGFKRSPLHPYESITHLYGNERILLIGTRSDLLTVPAKDFADIAEDPRSSSNLESGSDSDSEADWEGELGSESGAGMGGVEAARLALRDRIAATEQGARQLEEMEGVDALGEREGPAWIIWATVALCLIGTGFQIFDRAVQDVGAFLPGLFSRGEYWRAITMHFMHELTPMPALLRPLLPSMPFAPIHLAVNVGGMFVLGHLVERPLGSWRTVLVMAFSAVGTVVGIMIAGHLQVVGASGLVAGLAGSMLALELHQSKWMPAFWRLPRRVFLMVIVLQFLVLDQIFANLLAGGAHLGGFAGGYIATFLLGRPSVEALVPTSSIRFGAYCTATLVLVGFIGAMPLAQRKMPALERHAMRLLNTGDGDYLYEYDNAASWLIATEGGASDQGLGLAVALADRAVTNTGRFAPGVLDTLAEALYQSGDRLGAILTIDEAIRLQPREPYYFEQRRRFTGERDPFDRPPPPGAAPLRDLEDGAGDSPIPFDPDAPRVTI